MSGGAGSDPPWARNESTEDEPQATPKPESPAPAPAVEPAVSNEKKKKRRDYLESVVSSLRDGDSEQMVAQWLTKKGLGEEQIAETLRLARSRLRKEAPASLPPAVDYERAEAHARRQKDLLYGGLWFGGGLLLTLLSFSSTSASSRHYILAWGPMLYGAMRLARARRA